MTTIDERREHAFAGRRIARDGGSKNGGLDENIVYC